MAHIAMAKNKRRVGIIGGGPSGLFMYKRLIESGIDDLEIEIFERKQQLGAGMPYSDEGANKEHITNVSANEIPQIVTSIHEWVFTLPQETLNTYNIIPEKFNEYKVLPRLLFGQYLTDQFTLLQDNATQAGITTLIHKGIEVTDVIDKSEIDQVWVECEGIELVAFNEVIICTGHNWPKKHEGTISGYYDSPYPPAKLALQLNHSVAIKGSSLTAIDAIRTLARYNGTFSEGNNGMLKYNINADSLDFKMVMHSRSGLLPAVRFHLEDSHLQNSSLLTQDQIDEHILNNDGFLSLDYVFEKDFKDLFKDKDPQFYARVKDMDIEEFVDVMMGYREDADPFKLLRAEYGEAEKSIRRHESVYWKEMLAVLSFAMNYPAKYLSAEDMLRLQKVLMPLISIVIAFIPQTSCRELLALHEGGRLDIVGVGADSTVEPEENGGATYYFKDVNNVEHADYYKTFVDCVGQPHLSYNDFPFKSLAKSKTIGPAMLQFRSVDDGKDALEDGDKNVEQIDGDYYLKVSGITINDNFQVVDGNGIANDHIFIMAVPYIGGYNPDYSGLDFCEEASGKISKQLLESLTVKQNYL